MIGLKDHPCGWFFFAFIFWNSIDWMCKQATIFFPREGKNKAGQNKLPLRPIKL